jgi:ketosteroid isomerase-like protein
MRTPYQIVADHYAASARRDLPGMFADMADDVQWTEMAGFPCAGTYTGAQQIVDNVFTVLGRDWEGYSFTLERLIDGGDTVVGVGDYRGTHKQAGKAMHARVAHVWQVAEGKVRRFEQFTDTLLVANAMKGDA